MNWLKLKLRDWINGAQDTYIQEEQWGSTPRAVNSLSTKDINSEPTLNF